MEYRNLGRSGLLVSIVGVGCNNFGPRANQEAATAVVQKAIELGINLFDTADTYGPRGVSEEYLGKALAGKRDQVLIATKFAGKMGEGPMRSGASRGYIMKAIDASLKRLGTDYIDLYQIHLPDPRTPIEETMDALNDLVHHGKVRYVGHSNFSGWQTAQAHYVAELRNLTHFVSAQNQYNLVDRSIEAELVPACQAFGLSILPYFPLASGLLTGKYRKGQPLPEGARITNNPQAQTTNLNERNWTIVEKLAALAQSHGHGMTELSIGWLASRPYIGSVIAGAMNASQVETNVRAGEAHLAPEVLAAIDSITARE